MVQKLHSGTKTWTPITAAVGNSLRKVTAAIAFIGVNAPTLQPLQSGDIMVCDASPERIKDGTTSAKALATFHKRGVEIYSYPQLHAKVIVLQKRAFVGSSNASTNSDENLSEAVLETTDPAAVGALRTYVESLAQPSFLLEMADIKERLAIKVVRRHAPSSGGLPPAVCPSVVRRLWIVATEAGTRSKTALKVEAQQQGEMKKVARNKAAVISNLGVFPSDAHAMRVDDWMICVHNDLRVTAPERILRISPTTKTETLVWLARPKNSIKSLPVSDPRCAATVGLCVDDTPQLLRGDKTRPHLEPFVVAPTGKVT